MSYVPRSLIYVATQAARDTCPTPPWRHASWGARLMGLAVLSALGGVLALAAIPVLAAGSYLLH